MEYEILQDGELAHHLDALRAGVQVGNQFSSRIGYKV